MTTWIARRALGEHRRALLGYGIGLALMVVWVMALYPSMDDAIADYIGSMPEVIRTMFGVDEIGDLGAFLNVEIYSLMGPIVFIAVAVGFGASTIAGEEHDRTLQLVLAAPVSRRQVVAAKLGALVADVGALGVATLAAVLGGLAIVGDGLSVGNAAAATLQLTLLGLVFGTLALAVGAATGRRGAAVGVATGVAIVSYLVYSMAPLVDLLEPVQPFSPFDWYIGDDPMRTGLSVTGALLLAGSAALFAGLSAVAFERRDVGV